MLDYEKVPVRYFEFNKQERYALLAVKNDKPYITYNRSFGLYVEMVDGENIDEVKREGSPIELTREQALLKYLTSEVNHHSQVGFLVKQFENLENTVLLLDRTSSTEFLL